MNWQNYKLPVRIWKIILYRSLCNIRLNYSTAKDNLLTN